MTMKTDDILVYKDPQMATRYGTGVVTSVTSDEYIILWSRRGLTKYKRAILDRRLEQTLQRVDDRAGLPKQRHLQLGQTKVKVAFNEAPFGPVNRGPANRDSVRDRLVADPRVGSQQNLRPFKLARRVVAPAQHRRKLRAFPLVQLHPVPYVHHWSPAIEGNDESRGR